MDGRAKRLGDMKAEVFKAIGHPIRLAILESLRDGRRECVCRIAEAVSAERSNVSRHLAVMVRAGILTRSKDGLMVYYQLRTRCILGFLDCAEEVLRERMRRDVGALERLSGS